MMRKIAYRAMVCGMSVLMACGVDGVPDESATEQADSVQPLTPGNWSGTTNLSQIFQTNSFFSSSTVTGSAPAGSVLTVVNTTWKLSRTASSVPGTAIVKLCGTINGCVQIASSSAGGGSVMSSAFTGRANQGFFVQIDISASSSFVISPALFQGGHNITVNFN
jgi:hypothetical protein